MAGIIKGLVSDGTLPSSAKSNLATDLANGSSTVGQAVADKFAAKTELTNYVTKAEAAAGGGGGPITNTVILFGTSLEFQNGVGSTSLDIPHTTYPAPLAGRGWYHWANALTGNRLTQVRNAGISGNTYAQMRARIDADVLAYASDWVFMGAPMNDVSTGRTFTQITDDANAMLDKLKGRRVMIFTHPPHNGIDTVAEQDVLFRVNDWIRSLPTTRKNVLVADAWRAVSDGQTTTPATGLTTDGVHYSTAGAARVGKAAADALLPWLSAQPYRTSSSIDPRRIIANPALVGGTGWAVLGTGVTAAYTLDDNAPTTKAVLTYTGVTSTGNLGIQATSDTTTGLWAAGDVVQLSARIRWSGVTPLAVSAAFGPVAMLTFRAVDSTVLENVWGFVASNEFSDVTLAPTSGDAIVTTARYTVPATLASGSPINRVEVRLGFRGISAGTVTVSDVAAIKGA